MQNRLYEIVIQVFTQTKCNYSQNVEMHFKTVRGPGVKSVKFRDFKIRSVDGFGLAEKASSLTVLKLSYSQFHEKS